MGKVDTEMVLKTIVNLDTIKQELKVAVFELESAVKELDEECSKADANEK